MKPILIVEDESHLMKLLRHVLRQYPVLDAATAEEALQRFEENRYEIELLIADLSLPSSSGIQVALTVRSQLPSIPVILTSGYAVSGWSQRDAADLAKLGPNTVVTLKKPFLPQQLLHVVQELIGSGESERTKTA